MAHADPPAGLLWWHRTLLGISFVLAGTLPMLGYLILLLPVPLTIGMFGSTLCGTIAFAQYRDLRLVPRPFWLTYGLALIITSLILSSVLANGAFYLLYFGLVALLLVTGLICFMRSAYSLLWTHFPVLGIAFVLVPLFIVTRNDAALCAKLA